MMGWLCPYCGAENPISVQRCRACGEEAGAGFRAREMACAGAEHLIRDGQAVADACMDADPLETMGKTNRFAHRFVCVMAALFVVTGIWIGVQTTQSSGIDVVSHRLSSVGEAVNAQMTGRILSSTEKIRADREAAKQRWSAVCDSMEERISSLSPSPLRQELEAAQARMGDAFLSSVEGLRPRAETAAERWSAVWDGEVERIGNISVPPPHQELEATLSRVWSRAEKVANTAQTSCLRAFAQVDKLSKRVSGALQPEMIQEKAREALKSLVGWGTE